MVRLSTIGGIATGVAGFAIGGPVGALVGFGVGKIGCKLLGGIIKAPFKIMGWLFGRGRNKGYSAGRSRMSNMYARQG